MVTHKTWLNSPRCKKSLFLQCKTSVGNNSYCIKHGAKKLACSTGFSAMMDWMVWSPSLSLSICTHSQVVSLRLEGSFITFLLGWEKRQLANKNSPISCKCVNVLPSTSIFKAQLSKQSWCVVIRPITSVSMWVCVCVSVCYALNSFDLDISFLVHPLHVQNPHLCIRVIMSRSLSHNYRSKEGWNPLPPPSVKDMTHFAMQLQWLQVHFSYFGYDATCQQPWAVLNGWQAACADFKMVSHSQPAGCADFNFSFYVCVYLCVLLTGASNVPVFVTAVKRVAWHRGTVTIELSVDSWTFCTWYCYLLLFSMFNISHVPSGPKKLDHFWKFVTCAYDDIERPSVYQNVQ